MAGYSIVLNLSGNAVTRTATLARNLELGATNAYKLARGLTQVGVAARSIPNMPKWVNSPTSTVRTIRGNTVNSPDAMMMRAASSMNVAATKISAAANRMSAAANRQTTAATRQTSAANKQNAAANRGHSRSGTAPFLSRGANTPFGRVGQIFTFSDDASILGMNANKLLRGFNVASLAIGIVGAVGKAAIKVVAGSTLAPVAIGGVGIMAAIRALQSESFAEGVRLISRRHQSQLGLGRDFLQADRNTDFLAASYGLDRSTTLSSINVLTGLGIGGTDRKLSLSEATGLTKVGGLISQHHGVPFERVMTNIQQLLVQTTPHMRDIRELLNQAPILGKYALKEMEEKGIVGVDVRSYLKDQSAIMSVLKRYEVDVATNAGMQARGRISLAQQDMWARIAGNDSFWRYVGRAGSGVIGSMGGSINNILSMAADNDAFRVMVKQIEKMFDNLGDKGTTFIDKLTVLIERIAEKYGLDLGNRGESKEENMRERAYESLAYDPKFRAMVEQRAAGTYVDENGKTVSFNAFADARTPELRNKILDQLVQEAIHELIDQPSYVQNTLMHGVGTLRDASSGSTPRQRRIENSARVDWASTFSGDDSNYVFNPVVRSYKGYNGVTGSNVWTRSELVDPIYSHAAMKGSYSAMDEVLQRFFTNRGKVGSIDPSLLGNNSNGDYGDSLTGNNRDRRNLEIHFHAPIVELTQNIEATDPQGTVDEVADNIEMVASAAIQKALLGASGKMASRWY